MLEQLFQSTTYVDTRAKVATSYSKHTEEIIMETPDQEGIPKEDKDKEMKESEKKEEETKRPHPLIQDKEKEEKKDKVGPSTEDWGKGPI